MRYGWDVCRVEGACRVRDDFLQQTSKANAHIMRITGTLCVSLLILGRVQPLALAIPSLQKPHLVRPRAFLLLCFTKAGALIRASQGLSPQVRLLFIKREVRTGTSSRPPVHGTLTSAWGNLASEETTLKDFSLHWRVSTRLSGTKQPRDVFWGYTFLLRALPSSLWGSGETTQAGAGSWMRRPKLEWLVCDVAFWSTERRGHGQVSLLHQARPNGVHQPLGHDNIHKSVLRHRQHLGFGFSGNHAVEGWQQRSLGEC